MTWTLELERLRTAADPRTVEWVERLFQHHGLTPLNVEERLNDAYRLAQEADARVVGMLCGTIQSPEADDRERGSIGGLQVHIVYSELSAKKIRDDVLAAETAARSAFPEKLWVRISPRLLSEQRDIEREERRGRYQPMAHRVGLEALSS